MELVIWSQQFADKAGYAASSAFKMLRMNASQPLIPIYVVY